jgi:hypothetical protein
MSIVDQVRRVVSVDEPDRGEVEGAHSQLQELDEVETVLESIGVKLEPVFNISLTARIGAFPKRTC